MAGSAPGRSAVALATCAEYPDGHADDDALAVGDAVLAASPVDRDQLLYARVDLLPDADGRPLLLELELELVEPSLFLGESPGAAERFAAAIAERCRG